ncbi:IS66 family insertion sequence element accessory protein TnpB [Fundicoccus culcitae]|uniref:IS66 family insertion sequence element accessory protein TnpB n=1 Tax=Fundicoccus culcitae TaxID=2969821 RepID=A0ABY5P5Y5_9LACT|nr:IS66 family insertion sequence element accessory protein TnpB [Fundicoccus culcitae]UUX33959.1 IS66 family insertion sequence element accessory protein TnpB [Fundicoccus culcitae]
MIDFTIPETLYLMPRYSPANQDRQRLCTLIQSSSAFKPDHTAAYLFCNSRRNILRIIYWDGFRFTDLVYRLERGGFVWPYTEPKFMEISLQQLERLLRGDTLNPPLETSYIFNK